MPAYVPQNEQIVDYIPAKNVGPTLTHHQNIQLKKTLKLSRLIAKSDPSHYPINKSNIFTTSTKDAVGPTTSLNVLNI